MGISGAGSNADRSANAAADVSAAQHTANLDRAGDPTNRTTLTQAAQMELSVSVPSVAQMALDPAAFASPFAHHSSVSPTAISPDTAAKIGRLGPSSVAASQAPAAQAADPQTTAAGTLELRTSIWSDAGKKPGASFAAEPNGLFSPERMQGFGVPVLGNKTLGLTVSPGTQVPPKAAGAPPDVVSGTGTLGLVSTPPIDFEPLNLKDVNVGAFAATNFVELGNGESLKKQGATFGIKIEGQELTGGKFHAYVGVALKDGSKPSFVYGVGFPVDLTGSGPVKLP